MSVIDEIEGTPSIEQAYALLDGGPGAESQNPVDPAAVDAGESVPADNQATDAATVTDQQDEGNPGKQEQSQPASQPADQQSQQYPAHFLPQVPEGAAERLQAIEAELEALGPKLESGELSEAKYHAQLTSLMREQSRIERAIDLAGFAAQSESHYRDQLWRAAQDQFFASNPMFRERESLMAALNAEAKAVFSEQEAASKGYGWVLQEAASRVRSAFGAPPATTEAQNEAPKTEQKAAREAAIDKIKNAKMPPPMSLTDVPGGAAAGQSEFTVVASKSPADMAESLMSMPQEKIRAFLDRRV